MKHSDDLDGEATAATDALNHVAASSYNSAGEAIAAYQGQIASGTGATFSGLSPNNQLSYDVYVYSTTAPGEDWQEGYSVTVGDTTYTTGTADSTAPYLGPDWYFWGAVPVLASTTSLTVNSSTSGQFCLLQQISSTAYDADGNVTATTDALGRVSASAYNGLNEDIADYQGQVVDTISGAVGYTTSDDTSNWAFTNLSPNSALSYDVYVYSATALSGDWQSGYSLTGVEGGTATLDTSGEDSTAPSLGGGWYLLGTVAVSGLDVSAFSVTDDGTPGAVALLQKVSQTAYDLDGEATASTDALGNITATAYDSMGQMTAGSAGLIVASGQPVAIDGGSYGTPSGNATWTFTELVPNYTGSFEIYVQGDVLSGYTVKDSSDDTLTLTSAADSGLTPLGAGWYDMGSVTLTTGTEIIVSMDGTDTVPGAVALVWQTSAAAYDADGNEVQTTDGDGRVTAYSYDALNLETGEDWYQAASDVTGDTPYESIAYAYDAGGEMLSTSETAISYSGDTATDTAVASYAYAYNYLGEATSVDNGGSGPSGTTGTPGVPDVVLASGYDADGNRTSLSATVDGTADFVNTYSYDSLKLETQVTQGPSTASGHDAVDPKTVDFSYNADGQTATIDRLAGSTPAEVANSTYSYDTVGRLTGLEQENTGSSTVYADYAWTYDADNEATSFLNSEHTDEGVSLFNYDSTGQLVGATQVSGQSANASNSLANSYNATGNATSITVGSGSAATTTVAPGNMLVSDGTYTYSYDADGNLIQKVSSSAKITYAYDNRNLLTTVTCYTGSSGDWTETQSVAYSYDMFDNLIGRTLTTYGEDGSTATQRYVFDGTNMVLAFDGGGNLTDRMLSGPAVDQVLADEHFSLTGTNQLPSSVGATLWALSDNQNTVRDVVEDNGTLEQHIAYSPFGAQTSQSTSPTVTEFIFGYTGTYTDPVTNLQLHGVRWYDPSTQRWLTQDPAAADANLYRYCGNAPANRVDLSGKGPILSLPPMGSTSSDNGVTAPLTAVSALTLLSTSSPTLPSLNSIGPTGSLTIGTWLPLVSDDAFIHLTPRSPDQLTSGSIFSESYWAQMGDVADMTVPAFKENVVMGLTAGHGVNANRFVVVEPHQPGFDSIQYDSCSNTARVPEFVNEEAVTPGANIKVPKMAAADVVPSGSVEPAPVIGQGSIPPVPKPWQGSFYTENSTAVGVAVAASVLNGVGKAMIHYADDLDQGKVLDVNTKPAEALAAVDYLRSSNYSKAFSSTFDVFGNGYRLCTGTYGESRLKYVEIDQALDKVEEYWKARKVADDALEAQIRANLPANPETSLTTGVAPPPASTPPTTSTAPPPNSPAVDAAMDRYYNHRPGWARER